MKSSRASSPTIGVLLANLGTPDAPTSAAVRRYLAEFLSDPRIVDYPAWLWKPFLFGILLQLRPRRSARLYQRIWTEQGSPLATGMNALRTGLQEHLDSTRSARFHIEVGMRYGSPSIRQAMKAFSSAGISRVFVLPLFPQYSGTTTGSVNDAVFAALQGLRVVPEIRTLNQYFDHPAYLAAVADDIRAQWGTSRPEKLLFSFHGIPERYHRAGDPYAAQCAATAEGLAAALGLDASQWVLAFQSRFGPERWLGPATDATLSELGKAGIGTVNVVCPGFAVDCLETLDEIGHEGRLTFTKSGGRVLLYLLALNAGEGQIALLQTLIEENTRGWP